MGNKMNRQEFNKLVEDTKFDQDIKRLFYISYDLGFDEGRLVQMQKAIETLDSLQFEKDMK